MSIRSQGCEGARAKENTGAQHLGAPLLVSSEEWRTKVIEQVNRPTFDRMNLHSSRSADTSHSKGCARLWLRCRAWFDISRPTGSRPSASPALETKPEGRSGGDQRRNDGITVRRRSQRFTSSALADTVPMLMPLSRSAVVLVRRATIWATEQRPPCRWLTFTIACPAAEVTHLDRSGRPSHPLVQGPCIAGASPSVQPVKR